MSGESSRVGAPHRPRTIGVIPARLASSRFPEKVLKAETGKPLVVHVLEQARKAASLDRVLVAAVRYGRCTVCEARDSFLVMKAPAGPRGEAALQRLSLAEVREIGRAHV